MSYFRVVPVILLGLGNVGRVLLRQIVDTREVVARRQGIRLEPVLLADISGLIYDPHGLPDEVLHAVITATGTGRLLESVADTRPLSMLPPLIPSGAVLADVTAATTSTPVLRAALKAGSGVVLANKNPLIADWLDIEDLFNNPQVRYECTVGAGLPVIDTLHYLLDTGDVVTAIEGCMSGTLGYLCAELERGVPYSFVVAQARALGYTEPDPRDDLSGHDVARKALILARTAGWPLEMADLTVEALYPAGMADLSTDEFMSAAVSLDESYTARFAQAQAEGHTLRYVAQVGPDGGTVGLASVPQAGAMGALTGPANYIALHTTRYDEIPLVISGPGAGPAVTAAGVLGDIIALARN